MAVLFSIVARKFLRCIIMMQYYRIVGVIGQTGDLFESL